MNPLKTRIAKRRFATVELSDGMTVRLGSLNRSEQRMWRTLTKDKTSQQFSDDVLLALCICDDDGNQVISVDDALTGFFDQWDMGECMLLLKKCIEVCGLDTESESFGDRVGASIKNLRPTNGNGSAGKQHPDLDSRATNSTTDLTTIT